MLDKIVNYVEGLQFKIFRHILKKYNVEFYYRDRLGILSKRGFNDNFEYIFKTKNSCDAMPMMMALNDMIKNSNISIDIGANIGITTIWMARNSKKVFAFEPEKTNLERLKENLSVNNISNVEIIPKCVTNKIGTDELKISEDYGHHTLSEYHISKLKGIQKVETVTLDDFCKTRNINMIDLLKIDVEGYELEVLQGASDLLKSKRVKIIVFEYNKILLEKQKRDPCEVIVFLNENNYKVHRLNGKVIEINQMDNLIYEDLYAI